MGALTINRKRGEDYLTNSNHKLNSLYSPGWNSSTDNHVSKKPRIFSPLMPPTTHHRPVSSKSSISRIYRYPDPITPIGREVHAPCINRSFGFGANSRRSTCGVSQREDSSKRMGNALLTTYNSTKELALRSLRYVDFVGDKEVIDVDEENPSFRKNELREDLSVEEVEVVGEDHWSNEETEVILAKFRELDGKSAAIAENPSLQLQPFTSSVVSDLTNGKMLDLLSPSRELELDGLPPHKKLLDSAEGRNDKLSRLSFEIELQTKRLAAQQLLRPAKKKEDVVTEPFRPLSKDEEVEVDRALSNPNRRKRLVTHENSNIEITGEVLQCLRPGAWLNDEVINVYMELLKEREKREPQKYLKCHFFSTFFYKKLISGRSGYDYKSVRRWTTQKKLGYCLLDCDKIFVPVHKEVHWCLAVINKKEEKFQYLDSLGGVDRQVMRVLAKYIVDEVKDKSGKDIDVTSWKQEFVDELPNQQNGFDCGMFMIKYADFYSRNIGLCFNQEHMPYFRLRTAKEILRLRAE